MYDIRCLFIVCFYILLAVGLKGNERFYVVEIINDEKRKRTGSYGRV